MKINIIYWSATGNTEAMAELIKRGADEAGADVTLKMVSSATMDDLNCDVLALGCPSMGDEVLEEDEFEPFISQIEDSLPDKKLALFGSYGWGDGQWMRDWAQRMSDAGAILAIEPLIVNEAPDADAEAECLEFGRAIAT